MCSIREGMLSTLENILDSLVTAILKGYAPIGLNSIQEIYYYTVMFPCNHT